MKQQFASLPVDLRHGYTVEFRLAGDCLLCEWSPSPPDKTTPPAVFEFYDEALAAFIDARRRRLVGQIGPVTTVLKPSIGVVRP